MKINEVEAQVGITKKNIRFYEKEGLLSPERNSENGYRKYSQEDADTLRQIKLLRKLGVPLEEIRQMQMGTSTVADGIRRHLITLERERRNLDQSMELCQTLKDQEVRLDTLDAAALLEQMEALEQAGTKFKDKQTADMKRIRYVAPVIVTLLFNALMIGFIALIVWIYLSDTGSAPPMAIMAIFVVVPAVVMLGVLLALYQRIGEIKKGEADDAKKY